jgi:hypothetical protein
MPPLPIASGGLRIILSGKYVAQNWANVMYAHTTGLDPSEADLTTMATSLKTLWTTTLGTLSVNALTLTQVTVVDISSTSGLAGIWASTPVTGTIAGSASAAQIAGVISWKIARRYRGGHPRTYIPGIAQSSILNHREFTSGWVASAGTAANAWRGGINGMTFASMPLCAFVNFSFYSKTDVPAPPHLRAIPVMNPILTHKVGSRLDSQRRRLGKE